jgi:hypothetical protein
MWTRFAQPWVVALSLACAHPGGRPSASGAGTYSFVRYHIPCPWSGQCTNPPLIRSAIILIDESPISGDGACSARQGFNLAGCYVEDYEHASQPRPVAWRRMSNGDIEVGVQCGLDSAFLITLFVNPADEGRLRNFVSMGEPAEWPIEVKASTNADDTLRCAAKLAALRPADAR